MSIAIDPEEKVRIVLNDDPEKKDSVVFLCKAVTGRQQRQIAEAIHTISALDGVAAIDEAFRVLSSFVVGWEGIPEPFDTGLLIDKLSTYEAILLLNKIIYTGPTWADRKKSASPSGAGTAGSAKPAQV